MNVEGWSQLSDPQSLRAQNIPCGTFLYDLKQIGDVFDSLTFRAVKEVVKYSRFFIGAIVVRDSSIKLATGLTYVGGCLIPRASKHVNQISQEQFRSSRLEIEIGPDFCCPVRGSCC